MSGYGKNYSGPDITFGTPRKCKNQIHINKKRSRRENRLKAGEEDKHEATIIRSSGDRVSGGYPRNVGAVAVHGLYNLPCGSMGNRRLPGWDICRALENRTEESKGKKAYDPADIHTEKGGVRNGGKIS